MASAADENGFRDRLREFFTTHNPSKLANIDAIAVKYAGKEAQLFKALRAKYSAVTAVVAGVDGAGGAGGGHSRCCRRR